MALLAVGLLLFEVTRSDGDAVVSVEQEAVVAMLEDVTDAETETAAASSTIVAPSADADATFPAIVDSAVRDAEDRAFPLPVTFEILEVIPHDTGAFTQGLELSDGRLFESTGLVGESSIRELDPDSGDVLRQVDVDEVFAEGLTVFEDEDGSPDTAIQLTWQNGVAYRYDAQTFELLETYEYNTEGWGLCHDLMSDQLVMSDGTSTLYIRDPQDFSLIRSIDVSYAGVPVSLLNELECVGGRVWSNIWKSSLIIEIDIDDGVVTSVVDATALTPEGYLGSSSDVLNGIAFDESNGTFLVTGKRWPVLYRVRFIADG